MRKLVIAQIMMWACLAVAGVPALVFVFRFATLPATAESGFEGMGMMFMAMTWGPVMLFPLLGFTFALNWKRRLQRELQAGQETVEEQSAEPASGANALPIQQRR